MAGKTSRSHKKISKIGLKSHKSEINMRRSINVDTIQSQKHLVNANKLAGNSSFVHKFLFRKDENAE